MIKLLIQKVADAAKVQNPAKNFFLQDGLVSDLVVKSGVSSDSEDAISLIWRIWREFLLQYVYGVVLSILPGHLSSRPGWPVHLTLDQRSAGQVKQKAKRRSIF